MVVLTPHALFIGVSDREASNGSACLLVCPVGKLQVMFRGSIMPCHGSAYTTCLVYWCVR